MDITGSHLPTPMKSTLPLQRASANSQHVGVRRVVRTIVTVSQGLPLVLGRLWDAELPHPMGYAPHSCTDVFSVINWLKRKTFFFVLGNETSFQDTHTHTPGKSGWLLSPDS